MEEQKKYINGIEVKKICLKRCSGCKEAKKYKDFSRNTKMQDGFNTRCKKCENSRKKSRYKELSDIREEHPSYVRGPSLVKYWPGSTKEEAWEKYEILLKEQNYTCVVCLKTEKDKGNKALCVDHCHKTGKVRALLCNTCNSSIGLLKEDVKIIENALNYIKKHQNS